MEPAEQDAADERGWWHPRRWGWTGWAVAALTVVAIAVGVLALWVHSENDLRAIDVRAKSLGVPTTWAEHGLVLSPEQRLSDWHRLMQIGEGLEIYSDAESMIPGLALSDSFRRHYAEQSPAVRQEIATLYRKLGVEPVIVREEINAANVDVGVAAIRSLSKWWAGSIAIATPGEVPAAAKLALDLITSTTCDNQHRLLVATACLVSWQQAVVFRAMEVEVDRAALATLASRAGDWLRSQWEPAMIGEFLLQRHATIDQVAEQGLAWEQFRLRGDGVVGSAANRILVRAGRFTFLDLKLHLIGPQGARNRPEPGLRLTQVRTLIEQMNGAPAWDPRFGHARSSSWWLEKVVSLWCCRIAALDTCAAEWSGQPWPADPTDPARKPVRPVVRDGRTIGFYLLKDGVDDGGLIRRDFCFALTEPLGKPKAADPYTPPSR